jgi:hypothetical protein
MYHFALKITPGLLFTGWGSSRVLNFWGKLYGIFAKGEGKT